MPFDQQAQVSLSPEDDTTKKQTRRAPVACKTCRRLRVKCVSANLNAVPPCLRCYKAGSTAAAECTFPARGAREGDREFRKPRVKTQRENHSEISKLRNTIVPTLQAGHVMTSPEMQLLLGAQTPSMHHSLLPPYEEVIQGCKVLSNSYLQLGFIPKAIFLERLTESFESVSLFLLLSILSVSARFTPCLIERYGGGANATEYFIKKATEMVPSEMYKSSLDRTQALFLLAIADWGNGNKDRSSMHMGLAVTMAGILCLHREETYHLPDTATPDEVIEAEMARRTFWMIESQTNLHSGHSTPFPFALSDITAQLPCEESDFAFGVNPRERAVLLGTQAAAANPFLVATPSKSLFASLIQSHNIWGQVARRACRSEREINGLAPKPWESRSEYNELCHALQILEKNLPAKHKWSIRNLRGYKAESLELAYLATVMVLRLSNIVLRRIYLPDIIAALSEWSEDQQPSPRSAPVFWEVMSGQLFENVYNLYEQIDAYLPLRSREEGFPPIIVFCAYICGSLATYLWKIPQLSAQRSSCAKQIFVRCLEALTELQHAWPMALRWEEALRKLAAPINNSPSQTIENPSQMLKERSDVNLSNIQINDIFNQPQQHILTTSDPHPQVPVQNITIFESEKNAEQEDPSQTYQDASTVLLYSTNIDCVPVDIFEAELTAFLQGEVPVDVWSGWD